MKSKYKVFDLLTAEEIIVGLFKTQANAAREMKCKQPSVFSWVKKNHLPDGRKNWLLLWKWKELKELLAKKESNADANNQQSESITSSD